MFLPALVTVAPGGTPPAWSRATFYLVAPVALVLILACVARWLRREHRRKRELAWLAGELFHGLPAMICVFDEAGRFLRCNHRWKSISGYSAVEIRKLSALDTVAEESRDTVRNLMTETMQNGSAEGEAAILCKNGERIHCCLTGTRIILEGRPCLLGVALDISARKKAERALAFRNVVLSTQMEASIDGILVVDENARIISHNRRFMEMWGIDPRLMELGDDGAVIASVNSKIADPEAFLARVRYLYEHRGETSRDEVALGDGRVFDRYSAPMIAPDSKYYGRVWYFRDISDRKQAERVLQRSEEKYRSLVNNIPDVIWTTDEKGRTLYISDNVESIVGFTAAEMVGGGESAWLPRIHPDDAERVRGAYRALFTENSPFNVEYRMERKDGHWIWLHDRSLGTHTEEGIVQANGIFSDITARKEAEIALRASEEQFRQLADNLHELCFIYSADPVRCTYISPVYEDLFQKTREELYARPEAWLEAVVPEDRDRIAGQFADNLLGDAVEMQYRIRRKDGSERSLQTRAFPVGDPHGHLRIVGIVEDVTEHRRVIETIQRAREAAEAASRAKSEFLANMSHELCTPMNSIIGMADLALDTSLTPEQREYLTAVKQSADSLLLILNNILELSRIQTGKLELECVEFGFRRLLRSTLAAWELRAGQKQVQLRWSVAPDVPDILTGDPGRMRQIISSLAGNAVKFTENGEIELRVEREAQPGDGVGVHFSIRDTGIGIPAARLGAIFDAFTQADGSSARRYGGSGLGLTIVRHLVEMIGGRLWVESTEGQGSTFHFTARLREPEPAAPAAMMVRTMDFAGRASTRVLVVDPDRVNRTFIARLLQKRGYQVDWANDTREAQFKAAGQAFDLMLVDLEAFADGFAPIAAMRANEGNSGAHLPVIALTSHVHRERRPCCEAGLDGCVLKPVRLDDLLAEIERVLVPLRHPA